MSTSQRIPNWIKQRARLTPERSAIETKREHLTFSELEERVARLATVLAKKGVTSGDRVAFLQGNTLELIISYHALSYLEAVAVPLNNRLTVKELSWQIKDSGVQFLLYDDQHIKHIEALTKVLSLNQMLSISEVKAASAKQAAFSSPDEWDLDRLHTIIYTSGTTGYPKGVRLTFGNHWWSAIGSALNLGLTANDHWLCMVPLFHVSGLSILMKSLIYGMKMTLLEKFEATEANALIQKSGITHASVVGTMLQAMLEDDNFGELPADFRCMLLGGGPAPLPLLNKCKEKQVPVFQTYGLTESASQIVTLAPEYMFSKLGSAGKPLFPAQIQIMRNGEVMGPDQEGEILVKGPNVTDGYDHLPEATKEAIREGWLHTGDMGRLDADGFLYVLDRRKDMIVSGGENIYPAEVESVLLEHPDVQEAGVIGVPDERWGQVPVGFVVMKEGTDFHHERLLAHCRERLAGYKVPKKLFESKEPLPRNASKKLLRRELGTLLPKTLKED